MTLGNPKLSDSNLLFLYFSWSKQALDTRTLSAVRFHLFHNAQIIVDEKQVKNPLDIQQKISAIKHTKSLHIQGIFLVLNKT